MFSVIIPTLWKSKKIYSNLRKLRECKKVGEIIIINNNPSYDYDDEINSGKVKVVNQKENIYVNPAWNKGVKISENKNICLCNDDIEFEVDKVFDLVTKINMSTIGLIGTESVDSRKKTDTIKIEHTNNVNSGYGCLMFIHKSNYKKIPKELKVFGGDGFLFETNSPNFRLKNTGIDGSQGKSVGEVDDKVLEKDMDIYNKKVLPLIKHKQNGIPLFINKLFLYSRQEIGLRTKIKDLIMMFK